MIKLTAHLLRDIVEVKIILEQNNSQQSSQIINKVIVYTQVVIMHQHDFCIHSI